MKHLTLISGPALTADEQRLLNFVAWMGVPTRFFSIPDGKVAEASWNEFRQSGSCLAMSAATLAGMCPASLPPGGFSRFLNECSGQLLIFGCSVSAGDAAALSRLTGGMVRGLTVSQGEETWFHLPQKARAWSRVLAGLTFIHERRFLKEPQPISVFDLPDAGSHAEPVLTANDRPTFVSIPQGAGQIFLFASEVPDIEQPLDPDAELVECYHGLIPVLIFLRHCFGDACWHGPESTARLIIDDPTVSNRYGFLDFRVLLDSMHRRNYGTSVAFIPWNYWRTSRRTASSLFGGNSRLSLCVHGCDHINREFGASDGALLGQKAGLALERMEAHRKRTGVMFEPVMVFPQGVFSTAAISALAANHYLAAVNTTCFPTDNQGVLLRVGDFLRPAITHFDGFPIFKRHYPRRLIDFAFDLFLGKPVLVVEHHEYFRNGPAIEDFVRGLYQLDPTLSWPSLTDQLSRSCMMRTVSETAIEVRFFTRQFQFRNRETAPRHFLLSKHEPDPSTVAAVLVDGSRVPFSFDNQWLKLEVEVAPGLGVTIDVVGPKQPLAPAGHFGIAYNARVLVRRGLSEFRDNTLVRHGRFLKLAKKLARGMKVTGK